MPIIIINLSPSALTKYLLAEMSKGRVYPQVRSGRVEFSAHSDANLFVLTTNRVSNSNVLFRHFSFIRILVCVIGLITFHTI